MKFNELVETIESNRSLVIDNNKDELTEVQQKLVVDSLNMTRSMPKFKAKHFVGAAQITPYGAIKQFMLELNSRENAILNQQYEVEKIELKIDQEEYNLEHATDDFERRRCEIEIKYLKGKHIGFLHNLRVAREERKMYADMIIDVNENFKLEDGTTLLEALENPELCDDLERDYWIKRMGKQAATDMIAYGRVGVGNIDALTMMDKKDQRESLKLASEVLVYNENRMQNILSQANQTYHEGKSELADLLKLTKE